MDAAWIGLLGVGIGSLITLLGSTLLPWIREDAQRRQQAAEVERADLRRALLETESSLLLYRQIRGGAAAGATTEGEALARVGTALNELQVRLRSEDQVVVDVFIAVLAMVQEPRKNIGNVIGECIWALNSWFRGEVRSADLIAEVERRAGLVFSADRREVNLRPQ